MNLTTSTAASAEIWGNISANSSANESHAGGGVSSGPFANVLEPPGVRILRLLIQIFLFLAGVLGNVLVCIVTSRKRNIKLVGNRLILHLAIADLGIIFICFPLVIMRIEFPFSWPFGEFICRTVFPFSDIFYGVEIGCITAIALHRYRMLVHCMKPQMSVQTANRMVFAIWFMSFVFIVVPLFFVMRVISSRGAHTTECLPLWPYPFTEQLYSVITVVLLYVIPLTIILVTYVRIKAKLKESIRMHNTYRLASLGQSNSIPRQNEILARIAQNERAMRLLTPVVIIFAITMFPVSLYRVLAPFVLSIRRYKYVPVIFRFILILLIANSSVNPVVYSVVNTEFRREFIRILRCKRDRRCCKNSTEQLKLTTVGGTSLRRSSSARRSSSSLSKRWAESTHPADSAQKRFLPRNEGVKLSAISRRYNKEEESKRRKQRREIIFL